MKNTYLIFIIFIIILFSGVLTAQENNFIEIREQIDFFVDSINNKEYKIILELISENARSGLKEEFENNVFNNVLIFQQSISSIEEMEDGTIKVSGRFSAEGLNWNVGGFRNFFLFENVNGNWMILDSDFQNKIGFDYIFRFVGKIFFYLIPIFIILFAFWIWMLVDVIKRDFPDKTLWIVLIIILGFIGALLYFFIIRITLRKKEKSS